MTSYVQYFVLKILFRDGTGREAGSGWGTHVYLWWSHVDIWQNQYNIVKLKNKKKKIKKRKKILFSFAF